MASNKKLIAGPWVGEFGWELFAWQAYIRSLSKHYEKTTVICRPTSHSLYSDFADEFMYYNPSKGQADSFFMHGLDFHTSIREIFSSSGLEEGVSLLVPRRIGWPPHTHWSEAFPFGEHIVKPEYVNFTNRITTQQFDFQYDYIFHVRNRKLRKNDNWSLSNWQKLTEYIGEPEKIACIGTYNDAAHIEGTADLRGVDLEVLFKVMSMAKCVFGPSSGPMHLASLCGAPHVVWSHGGNKDRYEENWNPLKTPVLFLSENDWHPSPEYVFEEYNKWKK